MTHRHDPNSIHGAWAETGRQLGWEDLATACGVKTSTCRNWSNPQIYPSGPPQTATDIGDKHLKAVQLPPINHRAAGYRIGDHANHPIEILRGVERELTLAVRLLESVPPAEWDLDEFMTALGDATAQLSQVIQHGTRTNTRIMEELREAAALQQQAQQPHFPDGRPALYSIPGRR